MEITQNFLGAFRQKRLAHMASQFTNLSEVMADDNAVNKGEDTNPFDKYEQMEKGEQIKILAEEIEKGDVDVLEIEKADGEIEIEKGVYADTEKNRELNRVGQEIEKSDIMYAISGCDAIKVSKTGKKIKEQVDSVVLPQLQADLATWNEKADNLLKDCGTAPTKKVPEWWTCDINMNIDRKFYGWDETCIPDNSRQTLMPTLSAEDSQRKKLNTPENEAQAQARRDYNEAVRIICNIEVDIKACEILKNLKDSTDYELSPRQVLALKF